MTFTKIKDSFWRVPLISLIAGWLYSPCYIRIVMRFGVLEPGVIDDKVSLLTSGLLMAAFLISGWVILLRKQTRMEVFISASIVVVYGLLLFAIQILSGSTTGPAAVVFLYLSTPLEWMTFPTQLGLYLQENHSVTIPLVGLLHFFIPWLFALFCRKGQGKITNS